MLKKIRNNIPNAITCMNLASGVMAVILAFRATDDIALGLQGYHWAMIMIGVAAIMDYLDGFAARLLQAVSPLGAELDSLSDLVSFGLAPAMILFNLMTGILGDNSAMPFLSLLIPIAGALRLARFNVDTNQTTTFTGLPIPANAIFWIGFCHYYADHSQAIPTWGVALFIILLSYLMISNLRMFSLKMHSLNLRENYRQYLLIAGAVLCITLGGISGFAWLIIYYVALSAIFKSK